MTWTPSAFRGRRVLVEWYGCTVNQADALALSEVLEAAGATVTRDTADAEAAVLVSCAVIERTERHICRRFAELAAVMPVWMAGCLPAFVPELVPAGQVIGRSVVTQAHATDRLLRPIPVAPIRIADGCAGSCAYCSARLARGPLRSVPIDEIVAHSTRRIQASAVELRLTALDVAAYGRDIGASLFDLVAAIDAIPGDFMIRIGQMSPATVLPILDDLVEALRLPKVFSFMHLPLQSGSDRVLASMGRGYSSHEAENLTRELRKRLSDLVLHTDAIVGFPGETDEEFRETCDLLARIAPDRVNVTRYSCRPGTPASALPDMPDRFKKDRSRCLVSLAADWARTRNGPLVGTVIEVIVTEHLRRGTSVARDNAYRQVVIPGDLKPGTRCRVRCVEDRVHYLIGRQT
jgi:MiaB/RimO family radical SAM methylthiotransferase